MEYHHHLKYKVIQGIIIEEEHIHLLKKDQK
jgi:hypothetical protein